MEAAAKPVAQGPPRRRALLLAPEACRAALAPLVQAWSLAGIDACCETCDGAPPDIGARIAAQADLDAVLLVGTARRAPATVLPAPFVRDAAQRRIPLAWLPATSVGAVQRFALTAARVHRRAGVQQALAVFGQWHPRYLRVADRIDALLPPRWRGFRWTGERITREGLVQAIGSGVGLGLYIGHGRPKGWVGYHGVRGHHFDDFAGEPMGALLSLCCRTASRRDTSLSWAEALPLRGVAAASFGAISDTLHSDNTRWAVGLCDALASGVREVGELIVRAAPAQGTAVAPWRLVGDPFAPLATTAEALRCAAAQPTWE
jgi:hypothetical protein